MFDFLKKIKDKVFDKKAESELKEEKAADELQQKIEEVQPEPQIIEEPVTEEVEEIQPEQQVVEEAQPTPEEIIDNDTPVIEESISQFSEEFQPIIETSQPATDAAMPDIFIDPDSEPITLGVSQPADEGFQPAFDTAMSDIFIEPELESTSPGVSQSVDEAFQPAYDSAMQDIFIDADSEPTNLGVSQPVDEAFQPAFDTAMQDIFIEPQAEPSVYDEPQVFEEPQPIVEEVIPELTAETPIEAPVYEELQVFEGSQSIVEEVIPELTPETPIEAPVYEEPQVFEEPQPILEEVIPELTPEAPIEAPVYEEPQVFEEPRPEIISDDRPKGWFGLSFSSLKEKISKTSEALITNVLSLTQGKEKLDDDLLDDLEESLIKADLGLETTLQIIDNLRENKNKVAPDKLKDFLKQEYSTILLAGNTDSNLKFFENKLNVYLITGVNGVGKTTLIGKLAYRFKEQGKKVLVGAADTFRAAAEEQLNIWSKRAGADIVRRDGADPASVVYDAIIKAKKENYDVLLIDTAGRLHNKFNLMEELKKIKKIIDREAEENFAESILVLDATTGQNGLQQAKVFAEAVQLSSVALTKLDGSAKGGIIFSIASEMNLPVKLVGVGEKIDDLRDFNPNLFIEALFN